MTYNDLRFETLSEQNLEKVYRMCENNVLFASQSLTTFKNATIYSKYFKSEFSIVALDSNNNLVAFFMLVFRKPYLLKKLRNIATLKFFVVNKKWRNKGIGSHIYNELLIRIKNSKYKCFRMKLDVMVSMPDYWYPGLDPRQTEAFFFLKKQGLKKGKVRNNLCLDLKSVSQEQPPIGANEIRVTRAVKEDLNNLAPLKFMPKRYRYTSWPDEIILSFQNNPITTFIARDIKNKIIGWATHSVGFPGTFGPTGVDKKHRGKGLGGLLLKWCLWDLKQIGIEECVIRWVGENTTYFYLKSAGARICQSFWTMKKRI